MQLNLISGFLSFLMNIDLPGLGVLVLIFSNPAYFILRRVFRKKFGDNKGKIVVWSVMASMLLSAVLVFGLLAGFFFWAISQESR